MQISLRKSWRRGREREAEWTRVREEQLYSVITVVKPGQPPVQYRLSMSPQAIQEALHFTPENLHFIPSPVWFSEQLDKYQAELDDINGIADSFSVGPLMISTKPFKGALVPHLQTCIDSVNNLLPQLASNLRNALYNEMRTTQMIFSTRPESVEDYAQILANLAEAQEQQEAVQYRFDNVMALYSQMKQHNIILML